MSINSLSSLSISPRWQRPAVASRRQYSPTPTRHLHLTSSASQRAASPLFGAFSALRFCFLFLERFRFPGRPGGGWSFFSFIKYALEGTPSKNDLNARRLQANSHANSFGNRCASKQGQIRDKKRALCTPSGKPAVKSPAPALRRRICSHPGSQQAGASLWALVVSSQSRPYCMIPGSSSSGQPTHPPSSVDHQALRDNRRQ